MTRILITGSNSGFGLLTSLSLARSGHDVIATMRDLGRGDALREAISAEHLPIEIRRLDVCDPASVVEGVGDPARLDAVVNNAGFEVQGPVEEIGDELLERQFDTNVYGPLRVIRAVLPTWRRRGSGTVVNVSSIAGLVGAPYGGVYAATKHALEALSEALHFEVAQLGIRVRVVEPGRFDTGFASRIVAVDGWESSPYHDRAMRFRSSLGRLDGDGPPADPHEVANAIVAAITDPSTPFRTLVGDDAQLIETVKRSSSFEQFEATMRAALDWHE